MASGSVLPRIFVTALAFCLITMVVAVAWAASVGPTSKVTVSILAGLFTSPGLITATVSFITVYVFAHLALALAWHFIWRPVGDMLVADPGKRGEFALLTFLALLSWLLLTNHRYFPHSLFTPDIRSPALAMSLDTLWVVLGVFVISVCLVSLSIRVSRLVRQRPRTAGLLTGVIASSMLVVGLMSGTPFAEPGRSGPVERPHPDIILIGIDGLRIDHIGHLVGGDTSLTPTLDSLLADAAVVEETWTPLARTFPAWLSMLTGQYPPTHGGHYNLMRRDLVDDSHNLAHMLGESGYQRVYAIDETRFSNLDGTFGFDLVVAPSIGAFDFLSGIVGDLPLVNLIANTSPGRHVFPYKHMNRALHTSYYPRTFDRQLQRTVRALDPDAPLFMAVHYELPHWPYTWAEDAQAPPVRVDALQDLSPGVYQAAVAAADAQVAALIESLDDAGRLDDAILVLLSDHGEAFAESEPYWSGQESFTLRIGRAHAGHGTHVMSAAQNRVLLAFRGYGAQSGRVNRGLVTGVTASLADLRPTLEDWIALEPPPGVPIEGASLLPVLEHGRVPDTVPRIVTVETGFSLPSIRAGNPDIAEIVQYGLDYYEIDTAGRLSIRDDWLPFLLEQKQRAAVTGRWMLAAIPARDGAPEPELVLADFERHEYWNARERDTLPVEAPVGDLLAELCRRFGAASVTGDPGCPGAQ